jgi:hypothetical protein
MKPIERLKAALTFVTMLALVLASAVLVSEHVTGPDIRIVHAQNATYPPGFWGGATSAVVPAAIGSNLAVTNPASNNIVLVSGGPVLCAGSTSTEFVSQSTFNFTLGASANANSYLIVFNCQAESLYAKTAVTGPGSPSGQPGVPATLLQAVPSVEVPIALVQCGQTNCGNTANGTITDLRPLSAFPGQGTALQSVAFGNLPTSNVTDGSLIICTACTQPTTGSATCTSGAVPVLAVRVNSTWRCI